MPEQSSNGTQTKRAATAAKKPAAKRRTGKRAGGARTGATAERNQVQAVAETAVDLPVGAVLSVSSRVTDLIEPWTGRSDAQKQIKSYRRQLGKTLKRTERRGATARRRATSEARKTRTRVERQARKRQRDAASALKRNRNELERLVRRTIDEQSGRAQSLVDQVTDQLGALR